MRSLSESQVMTFHTMVADMGRLGRDFPHWDLWTINRDQSRASDSLSAWRGQYITCAAVADGHAIH